MGLRGVLLRLIPTLAVVAGLAVGLQWADWPRFDACFYADDPLFVPHPERGFMLRPGGSTGPARLNAQGLRGPILAATKPAGVFRVMTVGDSTAFGLGVEDDEAFAVLAPRLLADELPGLEVEWVIAALPGYSSYQSRVMLGPMLELAPDLVVFYVGARNDLTKGSYYRDAEIPERMRRRDAWWHRVKLLKAGENLVDFFHKEVVVKLRSKRSRSRVLPHELHDNLLQMIGQARDAGARVLVLVPPWSDELLERHPHLPEYRRVVEETAIEAGVAAVALQPIFVEHDPGDVYFPDRLHFNPLGHRLTAEAIETAVLEHGLLEGAGRTREGQGEARGGRADGRHG